MEILRKHAQQSSNKLANNIIQVYAKEKLTWFSYVFVTTIGIQDYETGLNWLDQANELPVKNPDVSCLLHTHTVWKFHIANSIVWNSTDHLINPTFSL